MNPQESQTYQNAIASALGNLMLQNIAAGITAQGLQAQILAMQEVKDDQPTKTK